MKKYKLFIIIVAAIFLAGCNPLSKNAKSGLQVITDGTDSAVFLDDQYLEKAPFINREIKPGEYNLKIQPDDPTLVAHETKITLRPGLLTVVTWKLAKRPELSGGVIYEMEPIKSKSKSEVSFITIPDGAIVSLQNHEKEFSPVIISDVNPGHNEFEISLPSYESQKHTINAIEGYRMLVSVKLAKIDLNSYINEDNEEEVGDIQVASDEADPLIQVTPSPTISPSPVATPTTTPTSTPQPTGQPEQSVLINSTGFFQDEVEVLRVRDAAGSTGKELGFATVGQKYAYLGVVQDNWFNISFNDQSGWVSGSYAQIVETN